MNTPPTETPPRATEPPPPTVVDFPLQQTTEQESQEDEYVVDVETHVSMLVQATTPEEAAAKAVLHTVDAEKDGSVTEVGRSVHTCVHSGLEESDSCDQHGEHNEE